MGNPQNEGGNPAYFCAETVPLGLSIDALIRHYETDPDSPRRKLRYSTKCNYDSLCRRLSMEHGWDYLSEVNARVLRAWHERWIEPSTPDGPPKMHMGHGLIQMLRILINFGATFIEDPDCLRLATVLHNLRFSMGKPRSSILTAAQATAVRARARALGLDSIALAQAFQFECTFRQKDVIGELIPLSEKGLATYVYDGKKWMYGIRWEQIDGDFILRLVTSKRQKKVEINLRLAAMVMDELERLHPGCAADRSLLPASGPVIVCATMGRPWTAVGFRRMWRKIADEVGVPKTTRNMDSRAGAITEAIQAGVSMKAVSQSATHSNISTTEIYARGEVQAHAESMTKRVASRCA